MRSEPQDLEAVGIGLLVDQHQIWSDVTLSTVAPLSVKGVVVSPCRQDFVVSQRLDDLESVLDGSGTTALPNSPAVAAKRRAESDHPHDYRSSTVSSA